MRKLLITGLLAFASGMAFAQTPTITAVLDAGGYTSNVAPGTVFVVKGSNLCATSTVATTPYTTAAMGGATISFTPAGGGAAIAAYMIYCFNGGGVTQLAAELPSTTATGSFNVTVTTTAGTSAPFATTVVARKFQLMTQTSTGSGRGLVQNVVTSAQYDLNGYTTGPVPGTNFSRSPGKAAEILIAWGTGLGAALGFDASAPASGLDFLAQGLDVKAIVNGVAIVPAYAGRSNLFPGLDNIYFPLPANVATGCNISLQVSVAGQLSNLTTISIAPNAAATACVDPQYSPAILSKLDAGGTVNLAYFALTSYNSNLSFQGQSIAVRIEAAGGGFAQYTADNITQIPSVSAAASGTCNVYTVTTSSSGGGSNVNLKYLDAGTITLNGPNVANKAFTKTNNLYSLSLGTAITATGLPPIPGFNSAPLITAGTYTLAGAGGADVGAFNTSITVGTPLTVTGGLPSTVTRSQGLTLNWTGGAPTDVVVIAGTSSVLASGTPQNGTFNTAAFVCTTTADKQTFTVPSSILVQLPATQGASSFGSLSVLSTTTPTAGNGLFSAPLTAGGTTDYALFTAGIGSTGTPTYQ